jgi:hypothetical protein
VKLNSVEGPFCIFFFLRKKRAVPVYQNNILPLTRKLPQTDVQFESFFADFRHVKVTANNMCQNGIKGLCKGLKTALSAKQHHLVRGEQKALLDVHPTRRARKEVERQGTAQAGCQGHLF